MRKTLAGIILAGILTSGAAALAVAAPAAAEGADTVICHKPGTPAQQTLTVDSNALEGHLGHGDTLGECAALPPVVDPTDPPVVVDPPADPPVDPPVVVDPPVDPPVVVDPPADPPVVVDPPADTSVEGWWLLPNGGTADNVTWPQPATAADNVPCGVTAQVDTYPSQAALDALAADGALEQGEDYGIAQSWRFVYGGDCPPVEPGPANPAASIDQACGIAHVLLKNAGDDILTASFVVYVDGAFDSAYAVAAGDHQQVDLTFPEDSGDHVVDVRTGPAFGDLELATATVGSDCEPAVVVPPTDTPTAPPAPVVTPAPQPVVVAPTQAPVVVATVSDDELAQTGSGSGWVTLAWIAGGLIAGGLAAIARVLWARRTPRYYRKNQA